MLAVTIPNETCFYHLYADGRYVSKQYGEAGGSADLFFADNSAVFLYYTYPAHRRVYLVRTAAAGTASSKNLPGLSEKVKIIFKCRASRVDKTKHAVSYLNEHYGNAYQYPDLFYHRLGVLISATGKLRYEKIDGLLAQYLKEQNESAATDYP
jgi:hypothetical protein